ncbi:hypothetical protein RS030_121989 [Cryptosporidium xiaoi]|uniref:Uncharacterized protein n=1 Tax=Cryptosporidium xiaoi TaxID=659607 RepID=A0AAV9YAP0_9CRYT
MTKSDVVGFIYMLVLIISIDIGNVRCSERLRVTPDVIENLQNGKMTLTEALDRYVLPTDIVVSYLQASSKESQEKMNVNLNGVLAEVFSIGDTVYIGGIPPKPENELTIYERLRDLSDPGNPGRRWCWKFVKHAQAPYNWGHITNFENCEFSGDDSRYQITEDQICTGTGGIESISIYQGLFTNYELSCIERKVARLSSADSCWVVEKGVTQQMINNADISLQKGVSNPARLKISVKPHLILKRLFGSQSNACNPENLVAPFKGLDGSSLIASRFNSASGGIELLQRCDGSQYEEALVELEENDFGDVVCIPDPPSPSWLCSGLAVNCKPF